MFWCWGREGVVLGVNLFRHCSVLAPFRKVSRYFFEIAMDSWLRSEILGKITMDMRDVVWLILEKYLKSIKLG